MRKNFSVGFGGKLVFLLALLFAFLNEGFPQNQNTLRIDSVSVIPGSNHVIIGWTLETEETQGSIVVKRQGDGVLFGDIANFNDLSVSNFIDNIVDANIQSFAYFLAAFYLGGSTLAESYSHRTIHLKQPESDFCAGEVSLSWSNYQVTTSSGTPAQQPVPFDFLRIQVSADGEVFNTIETLAHPQPPLNLQMQEFSVSGLNSNQYFFRIQAYNSETGVTSSSNIRSYGYNPPELATLQVSYVDIVENEEAQMAFTAFGDTGDFVYEILRSDNPDTGFEPVDTVTTPGVVTDAGAEASQGPWFYRVKAWLAEGDCALPAFETSEVFSSIFLSATSRSAPNEIVISWQHHFPARLDFFYTLKMQSGSAVWQDVPGFISDGTGEFLHRFVPGELVGTVIYKLEAISTENPSIPISSNYVAVQVEPLVHIPNAFRPTSQYDENRTFKPFFAGFSPENYQLRVFNRWGLLIFSSDNPEQGWDGNIDGSPASPGVYSYLLQYLAPGGKTTEKKGVVTLVY